MTSKMPDYILTAALAGCIIAVTIFSAPEAWYLTLPLLILFVGTQIFARNRQDRVFYLICIGELLTIACTIMNYWAGILVACVITAIVCRTLGLIRLRRDLIPLAIFCSCLFLTALLIFSSNHILQPLLILASICVIVLAFQSIRTYQFRKEFSGA